MLGADSGRLLYPIYKYEHFFEGYVAAFSACL